MKPTTGRAWLVRLEIAVVIVAASACAGLLGLKRPGAHAFEHRAHVLQGIACNDCHQGIVGARREDPLHLPTRATCVTCHTKPHDPRPCLSCHGQPFTAQLLTDAKRHLRFDHATHGELVGAGKCITCHTGVARDEARLSPSMGTCLSCHQHKDQFAVRDCNGCHVDVSTEDSRPKDHLLHDGDFVREHGVRAASAGDLCASCHKERFCASCHGATVPALPSTLRFDEPAAGGMHRAGFRSRHAEEARVEPALCLSCHTVDSCGSCHSERGVAADGLKATPHPPGWVGVPGPNDHGPAARRDPTSCASCHSGPGEAMCASCHRVGGVGGNPHPSDFDSQLPLGAQPCRMCHPGAGAAP